MFPNRYFAPRYFAPRYFPAAGLTLTNGIQLCGVAGHIARATATGAIGTVSATGAIGKVSAFGQGEC